MEPVHFAKLVALGFACALGIAPAAAQTPSGTMVPEQSPNGIVAAAATPAVQPAHKFSKSLEFTTIAAAAAHCPNSTVVWSSLNKSHSFHISSSRWFGKTKHGAYVCESDALAAGFHQAKS